MSHWCMHKHITLFMVANYSTERIGHLLKIIIRGIFMMTFTCLDLLCYSVYDIIHILLSTIGAMCAYGYRIKFYLLFFPQDQHSCS